MGAQGPDASRYRVVPRTLVFVRHEGRVLLMRRRDAAAAWPGHYNGVGGHVEAGEDVAASALREVREETGLSVRQLRLGGVLHVTDEASPTGVMVFVFDAESLTEAIVPSAEGEPEWVTVADVGSLPVVPDVAALLARLWTDDGDPPFLATASLDGRVGATFHA